MKLGTMICATLALAAAACTPAGEQSFVTVRDGRFFLDGKPYSYVGANFWYGAILGSQGEGGDRTRLLRELDFLKESGIDNLRILVGADGADGVTSKVEPALQIAPGVYNPEILDGLDFLLAEMGKRGMYAVLYLNNSWEWSGGYSQYLEWAGCGKAPVPAVDGWDAFQEYVARYADNEQAHRLFADHVRYIVTRTNAYTGLKYVDDPAIMAWQIGNEPRAFSEAGKAGYTRWMKEVAALIKSLDPNHLLSTGSEGSAGSEGDMSLYEAVHADPNIDYMTIHIWPYNWGWIQKEDVGANLGKAIANTRDYIDAHLAVAARHGKPVVMEEFGFPRDGFRFDKASATTCRDRYYEAVFAYIHEDMQRGGGFAGCNFWAWGGFAELSAEHVYWQRGDDYTGDPAQEQQGLNSVFASDSSTLAVVKRYAALLREIR